MVLREMNTTPTFRIYRNGVQQTALEATFPADEWSIPLFRADFLPFTSKIVEHSRYLLFLTDYFIPNSHMGVLGSRPLMNRHAWSALT